MTEILYTRVYASTPIKKNIHSPYSPLPLWQGTVESSMALVVLVYYPSIAFVVID